MSGGYKAFISSDGMEILVGNKDRDNDYLTFKVSSPQDFWLHVADNSGAHVIVRNENKVKRLPKNTSPSELTSHLSQKSGLGLTSLTFFSLGDFITTPANTTFSADLQSAPRMYPY